MSLLEELLKAQQQPVRRKVFISYYHRDDQNYRNYLESHFKHLFIGKSVPPGDIDTDISTEYIKTLIQRDYISDASVLLVLIGPKTLCRKHVDWEISAALNKKVGGYSGVAGILLPTFPLLQNGNYSYDAVPQRLADNIKTGYASVWRWDYAIASDANMRQVIEKAFNKRVDPAARIDNSRLQMGRNTCE